MKKFVKMISTVTVMCLLMASLAACGKKDSGKDTSGNIVIDETQDKETSRRLRRRLTKQNRLLRRRRRR